MSLYHLFVWHDRGGEGSHHHRLTEHKVNWDSAECVTYSTNYQQRLTLESWYTNSEQEPLNQCQQPPAPYKRLIRVHDLK